MNRTWPGRVTSVRCDGDVSTLHVVVPSGVHDVERVSGGNVYDVRLVDGLRELGHDVRLVEATGTWPHPSAADEHALASLLDRLGDGSTVVVDGLIASVVPGVLVPRTSRLRLVVLVHMPLGAGDPDAEVPDASAREGSVLRAADRVIVTSPWTRALLEQAYGVGSVVAPPGTDAAPAAAPSPGGGRLVTVGPVSRAKGHDVLVEALAGVADLDWSCTVVGSRQRDPDLVRALDAAADASGIGERLTLLGVRTGSALDDVLAASDLLVHPSRGETYGMVVDEAYARGIPVVASDIGGLPATVGADEGTRPGLLVPAGDAAALACALRRWLTEQRLRDDLRARALARRASLRTWSSTAAIVADSVGAVR